MMLLSSSLFHQLSQNAKTLGEKDHVENTDATDANHVSVPGADWPVGLLGWGPKGPPQQRSQWAPSVLEEKYSNG